MLILLKTVSLIRIYEGLELYYLSSLKRLNTLSYFVTIFQSRSWELKDPKVVYRVNKKLPGLKL